MKNTSQIQLPVLLGFSLADQIKAKAKRFENMGHEMKALVVSGDDARLDTIIEQLAPDERATFEQFLAVTDVPIEGSGEQAVRNARFTSRCIALAGFLSESAENLAKDAEHLPQSSASNGGKN